MSFERLLAEPLRNGLTRPKRERGQGHKMVNMGELFANPRIHDIPMDRVEVSETERDKYFLKWGDLLFARQSLVLEGAGKCSIFLSAEGDVTYEGHLIRARLNPQAADALFYYYFFRSAAGLAAMATIVEQVAAAGIRGSDLNTLLVPLPDRAAQITMAGVLGTLDDKIELNRRMNETLEVTTRALFKSWFVDFDPVSIMADGQRKRLPRSISEFFPDSFVETEVGQTPTGWAARPFTETVDVVGGGTPKTDVEAYWDGKVPWFSVVDAPAESDVWVVDTEKKITDAGIANSATRVLPIGTTIISARGTVGKLALVGTPMAMNQSCYGLKPRGNARGYYAFLQARSMVEGLRQRVHGSVFDTITRDTLSSIPVVDPPHGLVETFEQLVAPMMERLRVNALESRTLASLRDALLPKLISGELRIRDAEKFIARRL